LRIYKADKKALFVIQSPGPEPGHVGTNGRLLNSAQEREIKKIITTCQPTDTGCGSINRACWDRKAILALILNFFMVTMSLSTIGRYLKRWEFSPKRPAKKAHEKNIKLVEEFKKVTFPQLQKKCEQNQGIIVFVDETGLRSDSNVMRSYSPVGDRAYSDMNAKRFYRNLIISISTDLGINYMGFDGSFNTEVYITFLLRLIKLACGRKIYLVADNLKAHHSIKLQEWAKENEYLIELHYFPSYSQELNPVEYINNYIKCLIYSQATIRNKETLDARAHSILRSLQKRHKCVYRFFKQEDLKFMKIKRTYKK
jgi:transposase